MATTDEEMIKAKATAARLRQAAGKCSTCRDGLSIDDEFKKLIPALTQEEYAGLEASISAEGCRDALVVWNGTIIDGHNRYEICQRHNKAFEINNMNFDSKDKAKEWIILNQFSRRNLSAYDRSLLALKLKGLFAEKAQMRMLSGNPVPKSEQGRTIEKLAEVAGVGKDTIHKVESIERKAPEEVKQKLRNGDMTINKAYQEVKNNKPHVVNNSGENEWYTPAEYIEIARCVMGSIDTDPASSDFANQNVKAGTYYTVETNGLDKEWHGNIWMNPPYSQPLISQFCEKLIKETQSGNVKQFCVLVNNATETNWFQSLLEIADCIYFVKSRIKYLNASGIPANTPLQGQVILYKGENAEAFKSACGGIVYNNDRG